MVTSRVKRIRFEFRDPIQFVLPKMVRQKFYRKKSSSDFHNRTEIHNIHLRHIVVSGPASRPNRRYFGRLFYTHIFTVKCNNNTYAYK